MKTQINHTNPSNWRPQARFSAVIGSREQATRINEAGGFGVLIDVMRNNEPQIAICGTLTSSVCFWETQSRSGFVTKPKFSAGLLTLRFVTSGQISYLRRDGETIASTSIAALTRFDDLREVRASTSVSTVSATIAAETLLAAYVALTGYDHIGLPQLEPVAEMSRPGMSALLATIRFVQRRLQELDQDADLVMPLMQEIISYQLLSAWPMQLTTAATTIQLPSSRQIRGAVDYIEANLHAALTLAEVAASAGMSVRSLQLKFRKEFGCTPIQFIIERRLTRAHKDLISTSSGGRSIAEIARSWGFVHMGDFGQRYRRLFGCTPSQTRVDSRRSP